MEQSKSGESIRVGDVIKLISGQQPLLSLFESKILNIVNGGIVISEPKRVAGDIDLENGQSVHFQMSRYGSVNQFESTIKSVNWENSTNCLLEPPRHLKSVQRRDFVRLDIRRNISFAIIPENIRWRDWQDELVWCEATTNNLSGSGLLLDSNKTATEGDLLLLEVPFFDELRIGHPVLSICRRSGGGEKTSPIGVEFILGRSLGEYIKPEDMTMIPRTAAKFNILEQVKLSHFVLDQEIRQRKEKEEQE